MAEKKKTKKGGGSAGVTIPTQSGLSIERIKARLKEKRESSGSSDSRLLILRDGDVAYIHFLEEPDKWVWFNEHYIKGVGFIPCRGEDKGCNWCDENNSVERALTNVYVYKVDREERGKYKARTEEIKDVRLLKMTARLQASIIVRANRRQTICDWDADLSRTGSETDTVYTIDWYDKKSKAPKVKELISIKSYLSEQYSNSLSKKATKRKEEYENDEEEEEDEFEGIEGDDDDDWDTPF